jgi:hypothetical protein
VVNPNTGSSYPWLPMKILITDLVTLINPTAMKFEIDFPFSGYTKGDLIEFCFGKHANVDPAIPVDLIRQIQDFTDDLNGHRWYVMDYTENKIGGKLVNLKEKFFSRVAEMYMEQLTRTFEEAVQRKKAEIIPFRFELEHDNGTSKIVVYTTDETSARKIIMEAEGCPDSAIRKRRA